MAYRIVKNTRQNILILATATEVAIDVVADFALAGVTDTILGVAVKQVWSSADSGAGANGWDIDRGANTIFQTDSTSWLDFAGNGCPINLDIAATLTVTRTGTRGTLLLELQKIYTTGFETLTTTY